MHLTLVVLLALIPSITTLRCYVCNSNENAACEAGLKLKNYEQQCAETVEPYCRKIVQTVNEKTSIARTCGSKIGAKLCYKTAGKNSANVCSCNTDLCNHAASFNRQQMLSIVSSMAVLATTMVFLR